MTKYFTLFVLLAFSITLSQAQNNRALVLQEGFNTWPIESWQNLKLGSGNGFVESESGPFEGSGFATRKDENGACEDWLISPKITIPENAVLTFQQRNKYTENYYEEHAIYISTESEDPASGNFTMVEQYPDIINDWTKSTIDLSAYAGQDIHIGFHYVGNYATVWDIDDVQINTIESIDVEITSNITADMVALNSTFTPSINVSNIGANNLESIEITCTIGESVETKTVAVNTGESLEVDFTAFEVSESFTVSFEASCEDETNLANNTFNTFIGIFDNANAYGFSLYSESGENSNKMFTFQTEDCENTFNALPLSNSDGWQTFGGTMINNLWFVNMHKPEESKGEAKRYAIVDKETGEFYSIFANNKEFNEMAYNYTDGLIYAINNEEPVQTLWSINYITGETLKVADAASDATPFFITLAIDLEGNAYGIALDKRLYHIDLEDFTYELIGTTGVPETTIYVQSAAFDHNTNTMYWSIASFEGFHLYAVNIKNGHANVIGTQFDNLQVAALSFDYGVEKNYVAIRALNEEGEVIESASITIGDKTLYTDSYGYAAFTDIELGTDYEYNASFDELNVNGKINIDASKVVDIVIKEESVGISEDNNIDIEVYPNPSSGKVIIKNLIGFKKAELINLNGQILENQTIEDNLIEMNLNRYEAGIYCLKVYGEEKLKIQKIILDK